MQLTARHTKKIIPFLILLFVLAVFITPHPAHAGIVSNTVEKIADIGISGAAYIAYIVFYVIQVILVIFLYVASFILNNLLAYNIVLNPTNMPAVKAGWLILRDIANGLFLIVLLWLAIKIIWNIDEAQNKTFIVRLIIVAFLINFSLAITGAFFGLGGALAKPFSDKIGEDVGAFIVDKTKLNTVNQTPNKAGADLVSAAFNSNPKDCGLDGIVDVKYADKLGCVGGKGAVEIVKGLANFETHILNLNAVRNAIQMGISDIFLFFTVVTFGGAIAMLLMRIVMMVFLGVLAPAAFFLAAVPHMDSYFQKWLKQVLAWAFIAPTFYFLFYISLLILGEMTKNPVVQGGSGLNFAANIFAFLPLIVFLTFMWATMNICKKMAGPIAQAAIDMGKRAAGAALAVGGAVATGGASLALTAGSAAAMAAAGGGSREKGQASVERFAAKPMFGRLADPWLKYNKRRVDKRNEDITEKKKAYKDLPVPILTRKLQNAVSRDEKVALSEALHEKNTAGPSEFNKLENTTQQDVIKHATTLGRQENLLKTRLDLATKDNVPGARDDEDAQKKILNKMSPEEKSRIPLLALTDNVMKGILDTSNEKDIEAIIRYNADMMKKLITGFFDENKQWKEGYFVKNYQQLQTSMKQETIDFLTSNMRIQALLQAKHPAAATTSSGTRPATPPRGSAPSSSSTPPSSPPPSSSSPLSEPPSVPKPPIPLSDDKKPTNPKA